MTPDEFAKMIAGNPELQATDHMNETLSAKVSAGSDTGHVNFAVSASMVTVLVLPYPPSANRYWRNYKGRITKSAEARQFIKDCRVEAWVQMGEQCLEGDVKVTLRLYRPQRSGDLDNRIKVVLDALQGIAYTDDKQITEIHAYRYDDKNDPRLELIVEGA